MTASSGVDNVITRRSVGRPAARSSLSLSRSLARPIYSDATDYAFLDVTIVLAVGRPCHMDSHCRHGV